MALLTMLIGQDPRTKFSTTVGGAQVAIVLDMMDKESFEASAEPTHHPIENGGTITDHVILKPHQLSIEGIISESPLSFGASLQGALTTVAASIGKAIGNSYGAEALGIGGGLAGKSLGSLLGDTEGSSRLNTALLAFLAARDSRLPISIQTGLHLYENYLLSKFSIERNKTTGQSIRVKCELIEFKTVDSLVLPVTPKTKKGVPKNNSGHQKPEQVPAVQAAKAQSLLELARGYFFGGAP